MGFCCEPLYKYNVVKEGNAMARTTRALLFGICLVTLCTAGIGCFGNLGPRPRYTIKLYHQPAGEEYQLVSTKTLGALDEIGRVFADDPLWETNGWSAWVVVTDEDGNRIYDPEVEWTTDIPECIRILPVPERTDAVEIRPFPGSEVGRGYLYATYRDAMASLVLVSYGQFELTLPAGEYVSDGWSFDSRQLVDASEADLYITCEPDNILQHTLHAPLGIQLRNVRDDSYAFLEMCQEPVIEGFSDSILEQGKSIYEVIGRNGHYRVSAHNWYSGPDGQRVSFAWAPFWQSDK